jgi:GTPase SAR1 family protein
MEKKRPILWIGNKKDAIEQRQVTSMESYELAKTSGCCFFEVSAKTGENVTEAFHTIIRDIMKIRRESSKNKKKSKKLKQNCVIF